MNYQTEYREMDAYAAYIAYCIAVERQCAHLPPGERKPLRFALWLRATYMTDKYETIAVRRRLN